VRGAFAAGMRQRTGALRTVAKSPGLFRAELSFLGSRSSTWASRFAVSIVAYRHGGAAAVALIGILQTLPAAVFTPVAGALADRWRRDSVLFVTSACSAVALFGAAFLLRPGVPVAYVYVLAVAASVARAVFRPVISALLPSLCHSPYELTSSNAVRGIFDGLAVVVGPALAALGARGGIGGGFVASAAMVGASAILVRGVGRAAWHPGLQAAGSLRAFAEGIRAPLVSRDLALLTGLAGCETFTRGALSVFMVVIAFKMLGLGTGGVAWLMTALGVGGFVGAMATAAFVRHRIAAWSAFGLVMWGLPIVLIGLVPGRATAFGLVALVGFANAFADTGVLTLVARVAPPQTMVRVFALFEGGISLAVALGALLAPVALDGIGLRSSLVVIGVIAPLSAALSWFRLRRLDAGIASMNTEIDLLRRVEILAPLPLPSIERLARSLRHEHVPAGTAVFEQGDIGDRFYVIEHGEAEVVGDGQVLTKLGAGEGFGEIALLKKVPRTAAVRALSDLDLASITGADFVPAVTGHSTTAEGVSSHVDHMLERFTPGPGARGGPGEAPAPATMVLEEEPTD